MYAYLKGKLTYKSPTEVYVECAGVGYHVQITLFTYSDIELESEAKLYTYLQVREDALLLYGFSTEQERDMFRLLVGVSGVGPNTARLILSSMTTNELARAIIYEEVSLIQTIKGIGPKSAKRLVLELKDKVGSMEAAGPSSLPAGTADQTAEEAIAALTMLGFTRSQSEKAVQQVKQSNSAKSVEELIKLSLKNL